MTTTRTRWVAAVGGTTAGVLALGGLAAGPAAGATVRAATATPASAAASLSAAAPAPRTRTVRNERQLRRAVVRSNRRPGRDRLRLARSITFSKKRATVGGARKGDLDVYGDLVVVGRGRLIDANGVDRVWDAHGDARLVLRRLRMTGGDPARGQSGGAIRSDATVRLVNARVNRSRAVGPDASGGAVFNDGGRLRVVGSRLMRNNASRAGGAIEANGGSTVVRRSRLNHNGTGMLPGNGGAIHLTGAGTVKVRSSRMNRNSAVLEGGALWNSAEGSFTVGRTQLRLNSAGGDDADNGGGALYNDGGDLAVWNSFLARNSATGTSGSGGGIHNNAGSLTVVGGKLLRNSAERAGGGIEANAGDTTLRRTNLTANSAGPNPGNGGALHLTGAGTVDVIGSEVQDNTASAEGGGLWNSGGGTFTVERTGLTGNSADGDAADNGGGALFNDGGDLTVTDSTITGNDATGTSGSGGGVFNDGGTLSVRGGELTGNSAQRAGGAIEANAGDTTVNGSTMSTNSAGPNPGNGGALHLTGAGTVDVVDAMVTGNTASSEGGGLWNSGGGTFTVDGSEVTGNSAGGNDTDNGGGGLFNDGGDLTVSDSLVANNDATGTSGSGGGVLNDAGSLTMNGGSVLRGNTAPRAGGGLETNVGTVTLDDVDLDANEAGDDPGNGGGLHVTGAGVVTYTGGDVTDDSASNEGGGLWNSSTGTITATGITLSGNTAPSGPNAYNDGGTFTLNGSPVPPGDPGV